jgi:hypothetical protein
MRVGVRISCSEKIYFEESLLKRIIKIKTRVFLRPELVLSLIQKKIPQLNLLLIKKEKRLTYFLTF